MRKMLTQYKNIIYALVLVLATSGLTLAISNQFNSPSKTLSVSIQGPDSANVADLLEYTVVATNQSWFSHSTWQWQLTEATAGQSSFKQATPDAIFFGVQANAHTYYVQVAGVLYYDYYVYGYVEPVGFVTKTVTIG